MYYKPSYMYTCAHSKCVSACYIIGNHETANEIKFMLALFAQLKFSHADVSTDKRFSSEGSNFYEKFRVTRSTKSHLAVCPGTFQFSSKKTLSQEASIY